MIQLGKKVRDIVTGFEGIAVAEVKYLNGCLQYGVKPKAADNKMPDVIYIDVQQLETINDGVSVAQKETGGIMSDTPKGMQP